ncbi:hypothetical protein HPB47_010845 [Ixodes persulcatus]|uniref:Uncharacterized protein n=1 Tax=Ixodes persulcatus TaxID=34615 RepID=A0AC60NXY3_IXOPE|nr:hypothetical protein HPB47_010845 [Ixodes persulcatus]
MNFHSAHEHIAELRNIFHSHRTNAEELFSGIMKTACDAANRLGVVMSVPRQASRQTHRENYGIRSPEEYYRVAIYVPYMDSLAASLTRRFSETNAKSYRLLQLHPARMKHMSRNEFAALAEEVQNFYCIDNFKEESASWYEMWRNETGDFSSLSYPELLLRAQTFYPAVAKAVEIALALPVITCTVERSFSTLRRGRTLGDQLVSRWVLTSETPAAPSAIVDLSRMSIVEGHGQRSTQRTVRHRAGSKCSSGGGQVLLTSACPPETCHRGSRNSHARLQIGK